jgi:CheY-like chemotaxis protein
MKILIVEDDPLIREMAVEALLDEGYEVIEAENGEQALDRCGDSKADVLFTDIRLPGEITGWDVAEKCRLENPAMPVIYATGFSHIKPRRVPGSVWFQKPYRPEQIVAAIRTLTSG